MGLRRFNLDLLFAGTAVGVAAFLLLPDNLSLMPLIKDVCDLECAE